MSAQEAAFCLPCHPLALVAGGQAGVLPSTLLRPAGWCPGGTGLCRAALLTQAGVRESVFLSSRIGQAALEVSWGPFLFLFSFFFPQVNLGLWDGEGSWREEGSVLTLALLCVSMVPALQACVLSVTAETPLCTSLRGHACCPPAADVG